MESSPIDLTTETQPAERPAFLSVLCILTWIACGLLFVTTVWGVLFTPSMEQQYENIEKMREHNPQAADKLEELLAKQQEGGTQWMSTLLSLVAIGLSAYGAFMMWHLKKTGFYLYAAGELLPYIGFVTGGAEAISAISAMGGGEGVATMMILFLVFIDLLFIGLYAANLKAMKR